MSFILLIVLILCLYKIKFATTNIYFKDYMSIEKTTCINGIFVIMVFLRHFSSYVTYSNIIDYPFVIINNNLSQLIVTTFLFYSGYGIMESIKTKNNYIDKIPFHRVFKILFHFDVAVIFFYILNIIYNHSYSISEMILAFFAWNSIGNSCWYIFAICILYIITFISFKLFKNKYIYSLISITILSVVYVIIISNIKDEASWYNTFFCYVAGMWFSLYKVKFEEFIFYNKNYIYTLLGIILLFVISTCIYIITKKNLIFYEIDSLLFVFLVIIITIKIEFNNYILKWLGKHMFSIYILQRIPMIIFDNLKLSTYNKYLYLIISFFATLIISYMFNIIIKKIDRIIFN